MFTEPYKLVNKNEKSAILITCEHASNRLPPSFSLPKRLINSHWALDVGISKVVDKVSEILDCTAIKANYSRLIIGKIADYNLLYSFMFMGIIILANTLLFRVNNKHLNNS